MSKNHIFCKQSDLVSYAPLIAPRNSPRYFSSRSAVFARYVQSEVLYGARTPRSSATKEGFRTRSRSIYSPRPTARAARICEETLRDIRRTAARALRLLSISASAVEVAVLDPQEMRRAGMRRKKQLNYIPEVLAFPEPERFPHPETRRRCLGEVLLNRTLLKRKKELVESLVHGIVHLAGYTHDAKHDTLNMEALERKILGALPGTGKKHTSA